MFVWELADGTLYMNARSRQGRLSRASAWSHDGGVSWTDITYSWEMPGTVLPGKHNPL